MIQMHTGNGDTALMCCILKPDGSEIYICANSLAIVTARAPMYSEISMIQV